MPPGTDLTYSWSQALADLGQIAPIVALVGFFLFAVVVDLVLPRSRRGGAVAMFAVHRFALSLLTAGYQRVFTARRCPQTKNLSNSLIFRLLSAPFRSAGDPPNPATPIILP